MSNNPSASVSHASSRNPAIELVRVFACLLVLLGHTCFYMILPDPDGDARFFYLAIGSVGVGIFFMISGFFLFGSSDYGKLWKRSARRIFLPAIAILLFTFYFSDFLIDGTSLAASLNKTPQEYLALLGGLLRMDTPAKYTGQLWYVFCYLNVLLLFPAVRGAARWMDEDTRREKGFLLISFLLFLVNDLMRDEIFSFGNVTLAAAVPAAIEMLWGHILYRHRGRVTGTGWLVASLPGFVALNVLRLFLQRAYLSRGLTTHLNDWFCSLSFLSAALFLIFFMNLLPDGRASAGATRFINGLASCTLTIYLIHPLFQEFMRTHGIWDAIHSHCRPDAGPWVQATLQCIMAPLLLFAATLLTAVIIRLITGIPRRLRG